MNYGIFLSYRRKDKNGVSNVPTARTFKLEFEKRGYKVFFDYSECTDDYFTDRILPAIRTCKYFVLVLTKDCLERCQSEGDWVRREIEEALKYNRKIIPITPDGVFESWPNYIPDSLSKLSEGLQITTIHMDRVFEANIELLIKDRMEPPSEIKPSREKNSNSNSHYLKVISNLDCVLYIDEEVRAHIKAGKLEKISLSEGEYMLQFVSKENSADQITDEYEMPDKDKLYNVDLLSIRKEREEEHKRKLESLEVKLKLLDKSIGELRLEHAPNYRWGFVDKTGKVVIPYKWMWAKVFSEGLAAVKDDNDKFGFIDKTGKVVIPCKWDDADLFSEGLAVVGNAEGKYGFIDKTDAEGKYGFIDKTGKVVIPCQWKNAGYFHEGLALVRNAEGKDGFIDKTGKVVISCQWEYAGYFWEGLAVVKNAEGKYGFIDKKGKVVIPYQWEYAGYFHEGLAVVRNAEGKGGFIDKTGKVVIPCQWKSAGDFFEGLAVVVNDEGKYGFINKKGKVVIPYQWDDADIFSEGLAFVRNAEGKYGFIDKTGKVVIPCQWEYAGSFDGGKAKVKDSSGKQFYIGKTGKIVD